MKQKNVEKLRLTVIAIIAFMVSVSAFAADQIEQNGIYYEILSESDKTCQVTGGAETITTVKIPLFVNINNKRYSVVSVKNLAFHLRKEITAITIPSSVTSLGDRCFASTGIESIIIPSSIKEIPNSCFSFCDALRTVTLPDGLEKIAGGAFGDCHNLSNIVLPETLVYLGGSAFRKTKISSVRIPKSVLTIGYNPFPYPGGPFDGAVVDEDNPNYVSIDGTIYDKSITKIISVKEGFSEIPSSITEIGDYSFAGQQNVTSMTIPDNVISIGRYAFAADGNPCIKTVTLGSGIKEIKSGAFSYCRKIESIYSRNTVPPLIIEETYLGDVSNVFRGIAKDEVLLYVPRESVETYKATPVWKEFNIVGYDFDKIKATGIELDKTEMNLIESTSQKLTATVTPDDATEKSVAWSSSNENVATVDQDGNVTAKAQGTAVITATTTDGSDLSATCNVNVTISSGVDIPNVDEDALVGVFTASGVKVYYGKFSGWNRADKGLYIVRTADKTFKTIIR